MPNIFPKEKFKYGDFMTKTENRVCHTQLAGSLDNRLRRWIHNPSKILKDYIFEGMTVLDVGCGPGLFTLEMAHKVGKSGRVLAADLHQEMLDIVKNKVLNTELQNRISFIKCSNNSLNINSKFDFGLAFYMVHEVPDKDRFFKELKLQMNAHAKILIVEPKIFHVSKKDFNEMKLIAAESGFKIKDGPKVFGSQSVILTN